MHVWELSIVAEIGEAPIRAYCPLQTVPDAEQICQCCRKAFGEAVEFQIVEKISFYKLRKAMRSLDNTGLIICTRKCPQSLSNRQHVRQRLSRSVVPYHTTTNALLAGAL